MVEEPVVLRAARPDLDEGLVFARYLNAAAEGFFEFWLGRNFAGVVAQAFTKPGHDLSHEYAAFAVRGGRIVGMALCYSAEQHRASLLEPLREAEGYRAFRSANTGAVMSPIMRVLDTLEDGDFYLQAIAVDEDLRGAGVGSILIGGVEEQGRASGSRRLCLDLASGWFCRPTTYERLGMEVVSESKIFYMPRVRLLRMAKAI